MINFFSVLFYIPHKNMQKYNYKVFIHQQKNTLVLINLLSFLNINSFHHDTLRPEFLQLFQVDPRSRITMDNRINWILGYSEIFIFEK